MNFDARAISISLIILATIASFYVLVAGQAFLVPLAVAIMIWYVINALSRIFVRIVPKIDQPNWFTALLSLVSIGLFFLFTIDIVQSNIPDLRAAIPSYKVKFDQLSLQLIERFNLESLPSIKQFVSDIKIGPVISGLVISLTNMLGNVFLVPIYVLFLMLEQKTFKNKIEAIFPDQAQRGSILSILSHTQDDIQTYLWIKTLTSMLTGMVSYGILLMVGVDFAGFWAFTIFLLNFIPTIGSIIATFFPAMLALIQFDTTLPFVIVLFGVGTVQIIVGNFLEPKMMGNTLNLSPLVVMLSLTLWGSIWGIAGMFLSVPITVALMIIFAHFDHTRYLAVLLSGDGNLKFTENNNNLTS